MFHGAECLDMVFGVAALPVETFGYKMGPAIFHEAF
jgi:hypothetical protein